VACAAATSAVWTVLCAAERTWPVFQLEGLSGRLLLADQLLEMLKRDVG